VHARKEPDCNLNIEKGRYLNTPAEDRICKLCNSGVEDEFHFIIICSKLQSCREEFFKDISVKTAEVDEQKTK
jgi:diphthamide biosynthesis methyltransferase